MSNFIKNLNQVVTPIQGKEEKIKVIENGFVEIDEGKIVQLGSMEDLPRGVKGLDGSGTVAVPGYVDPHTHLIFAGTREEEFIRRAKGEQYGTGGISQSALHMEGATVESLVSRGRKFALRMLAQGTTTIEIKTGYGLSTEKEIMMLEAIKKLDKQVPQDLVPTFLGAHSVPEGKNKADYINEIITEMIPEIRHRDLAAFCDVFCDEGFYTLEESKTILKAAKAAGMELKIHADEIVHMGGAALIAELGGVSADHLLKTPPGDLQKMKAGGVIPVLLPGTAFSLNEKYPAANEMVEAGLPVALGTDFNPGTCLINSMNLIFSLAVLKMGLDPRICLTGTTLNAAKAIKKDGEVGSLEPGKKADVVLFDVENYRQIFYFFGHNLVDKVLKEGAVVYDANETEGFCKN